MNDYLNHPSSSSPLMNMVRDMHIVSLTKGGQEFSTCLVAKGSWKCMRKDMARELKSWKEARGSSIHHFASEPISVHWKRHKRIESSMREFDEHHKWKVITWLFGSLPGFPSNFRISEGSLAGITSQTGEWKIGSFVNWDKSRRSRVARKGSCRWMCEWYWCGIGTPVGP